MMRDWLPYRDLFLETIIDLEGPTGLRTCAGCSANWSPWRCMDCLDLPALCTACCLNRHAHDYLHRIEKWTDSQVDVGSHREGAGSAFFSGPDSDEEDEAEDDDEAAEGEEDEMDEAFVLPPAGQGPIQSEEGKLDCGYRTLR